jgi:hypothetical protein
MQNSTADVAVAIPRVPSSSGCPIGSSDRAAAVRALDLREIGKWLMNEKRIYSILRLLVML